MADTTSDVGRAIRRIKESLEQQERRNNPDAELNVAESASDTIDVTDSVSTTERTGSATVLKYDTAEYQYGFGEYG